MQFAEDYRIPFGEAQAGKSAIVASHPLNMGGIGTTGGLAANLLAKEADLVIGVGTRFTDFTTASKSLFSHPNVAFLNINVAEFDASKLDALKVVADAKEALQALSMKLKDSHYETQWGDKIQQAKQQWKNELERLFSIQYHPLDFVPEIAGHLDDKLEEYRKTLGTELTQTRVLGLMQEYMEDDAIIVGAAGSLPGDLQRIWLPKKRDTYHLEYGYSCMGYEIAAAVGAKIAVPQQPVYAMVGDGSYLMLHSELQTAIQENIKITILLFDNAGFGCINNLQMSQGMGSFGTENRYRNPQTGLMDGPLVKVDFAKNAESYGCKSYRVHDEEQLVTALKDAKSHSGCVLIDIKVLPKTMTDGYEAWWRTGTAQVSKKPQIVASAEKIKEMVEHKVRLY